MKWFNRVEFLKSRLALPATIFCASFIFSVSGYAAEPVSNDPGMASFDWSGLYIGGNLGGLFGNYNFHGPFLEDVDADDQFYHTFENFTGVETGTATFFAPHRGDLDGAAMGGGQIGYQQQFGHFVLGIEGMFDRTSTTGTSIFKDTSEIKFAGENSEVVTITADTTLSITRQIETNWNGAVVGKVGYAQGIFLFYALGGATWTDVNFFANDRATTSFTRTGSPGDSPTQANPVFVGTVTNSNVARSSDVLGGWTAGGGIAVAVSNAVSMGLEYRHNDFGDATFHFSPQGGPISPAPTHVDLSSDQVALKFNVQLGHLFGRDNYASTTGENIAVGYTAAIDAKDKSSGKDKEIAVAPEEPFSWTGFYIGGNIGGVWTDYDVGSFDTAVDVDQQFTAGFPFSRIVSIRTPGVNDLSENSLLGGGQLGFQKQWGHFVGGVEADFSGMSADVATRFSETTIAFVDFTPYEAVTNFTTFRETNVDWNASARARLGWAQGRLLMYATGGGAWAKVTTWERDIASTDFILFGTTFAFNNTQKNVSKNDDIVGGWTVGGGAEWAMTKIASLGLEYRHNWFEDQTDHFSPHHGLIIPGSTHVGLDSDQVTLRVNILLGNIHSP